MTRSPVAAQVLDAVERAGLLLVHDAALPCVTALVTGGPLARSWWSHPLANAIYAREPWQPRRLPAPATDLRAEVDAVDAYVVPAADRSAADALEQAARATSTDVGPLVPWPV